MTDVVIPQPIHPDGVDLLRRAGLWVFEAPDPSLAVLSPHLARARAVITRNLGFCARAMAAAPHLRVIVSHGTGTDAIDTREAAARGIAVFNTPGTNARSVAEQALALMLACARSIPAADRAVRAGDFAFRERARPVELGGRVLGLIGYGRTARALAGLAQGIGMKVLACSAHASASGMAADGVTVMRDADALMGAADVVSLHGIPGQAPVFDAARLARMRPGAILINTARGALVDAGALIAALQSGHLRAAALDVFASEPLAADDPLCRCDCPGLILTPHMGGSADEARVRTATAAALQVIAGLGLPLPDTVQPLHAPRRDQRQT